MARLAGLTLILLVVPWIGVGAWATHKRLANPGSVAGRIPDWLELSETQIDARRRLAEEWQPKIERSSKETEALRGELERRQWDLLTEGQKARIASWRKLDRSKVSLEAALVGYWERLEGHGDYEFLPQGKANLYDEGFRLQGTWKILETRPRERMVRVRILGIQGDRDLVVRFTKDQRILLLSYEDPPHNNVGAWRYLADRSPP